MKKILKVIISILLVSFSYAPMGFAGEIKETPLEGPKVIKGYKDLPKTVDTPSFDQEVNFRWEIYRDNIYLQPPPSSWVKGKIYFHEVLSDSIYFLSLWKGGETIKIPQGPWKIVSIKAYKKGIGGGDILMWKFEWRE